MATAQPKSGVTENTTTTGTGDYVLAGALAPWAGFVAGDDAKAYPYGVYQAGVGFEVGIGTYTHSTRSLSRTTVLRNHLNTTSPVDWGAGTKELSIVIAAEKAAILDGDNVYSGENFFDGGRIYLDADQDTFLTCELDDIPQIYSRSLKAFELNCTANIPYAWLIADDDTASEGPEIACIRNSNTPAINDIAGVFAHYFKDLGGNRVYGLKISTSAIAVTNGAASSAVDFKVLNAGAITTPLQMRAFSLIVQPLVSIYTAQKAASNVNVNGAEILSSGGGIFVVTDDVPLYACRKGSDGPMIQIVRDGVVVGTCSVLAGATTWGPFTGHHYVEWLPGHGGPEYEKLGTVLARAPGMLAESPDPVKYVVPAVNGSRKVYGVFAAREPSTYGGPGHTTLIAMHAVGNGWIRAIGEIEDGDLLWASATSGVAEKQPDQDVLGPWTIATAINDSPDDGERLVPCVFHRG